MRWTCSTGARAGCPAPSGWAPPGTRRQPARFASKTFGLPGSPRRPGTGSRSVTSCPGETRHGGTDMRLPSRIVDLSMPLDNETTCDPDIMRPKIQYVTQKDNAEAMAAFFEGMRAADLPHGEGWAWG